LTSAVGAPFGHARSIALFVPDADVMSGMPRALRSGMEIIELIWQVFSIVWST
jgi:hypothetical protein